MQYVVEVWLCPINFTVIFGEAYLALTLDLFALVQFAPVLNTFFIVVFAIVSKTLKHKHPGWLDCDSEDKRERGL